MIDVRWSNIARKEYWKNIDYLLKEWTEKEAVRFIELVDSTIAIIKKNPKAFPVSGYRTIRSAVITP